MIRLEELKKAEDIFPGRSTSKLVIDKIKNQIKLEKILLDKHFRENCKIPIPHNRYSVENEFYNSDVMNNMTCSIEKFFLDRNVNNEDQNVIFNLLKRNGVVFRNKDSGVFVYKYDFNGNNIICKTLYNLDEILQKSDRDGSSELIHETIVGFYATNKLRELGNPNFAYVYGYFECKDTLKSDGLILNTNNGKKSAHILYENIEGISFERFCQTCTKEEFILVFAQILFSLKHANELFDFTHYDLHLGNLNVRKITNYDFSIKYPLKNNPIFCKSNGNVVTFFDYGRSHIKIDGIDFGITDPDYGFSQVFNDRPFYLTDSYKILMSSLCAIWYDNNNIDVTELFELTTYFNGYNLKSKMDIGNIYKELESINKQRLYLPYCKNTASLTDIQWEEFKILHELPTNYNIDLDNNLTNDGFIEFFLNFAKKLNIKLFDSNLPIFGEFEF